MRDIQGLLRRTAAATVSAALILVSPGVGCYEALAQNIRGGNVRTQTGTGRGAPVPSISGLSSPLNSGFRATGPAFSGGLPGSSAQPQVKTGPSASSAQGMAPSFEPVSPVSLGSVESVRSVVPSVGSKEASPSSSKARFNVVETLTTGQEVPNEAVNAPSEGPTENSREWAEGSFHFLKGDGALAPTPAAPGSEEPAVSRPSGLSKTAAKRPSWIKATAMAVVGTSLLGLPTLAQSVGAPDSTRAASPASPTTASAAAPVDASAGGLGMALGQAGYWIGNFLAFLFPLPQVYKTIKEGTGAGTPLWRVGVLAAASFALGAVNATVQGKWFWGVQNMFGALSSLAVIPVGWILSRKGVKYDYQAPERGEKPSWKTPGARLSYIFKGLGHQIRHDRALHGTAIVAALVLGMSFGLYFAAAAVMPPLLTASLGAVGIGKLTLWIQAVTGAMYFMLFLPDIKPLLKGEAPKGFTPTFSKLFLATSAAFVVWAVQEAFFSPAGSAERQQYVIYALLNAAYAVAAFLSVKAATRAARKAPVPAPETAPEPVRGPPPAANASPEGGRDGSPTGSTAAEAAAPQAPQAPETKSSLLKEKAAAALELLGPAIGTGALMAYLLLAVPALPVWGIAATAPALAYGLYRFGKWFHGFQDARISARHAAENPEQAPPDQAPPSAPSEKPAGAPAADTNPEGGRHGSPTGSTAEPAPPETPAPAPAPAPEAPSEKPAPPAGEPAPSDTPAPGPAQGPKLPRSWKNLPEDARGMTPRTLQSDKEAAQRRARRMAKDARLVGVAINLDDSRAHWSFTFHSPSKGKIYTVWPKRIGVKKAPKGYASETIWNTRLAKVTALDAAYAALKAEKHWFKPVRVELSPVWKTDPIFVFIDERGRRASVPATAVDPVGERSRPPLERPSADGTAPPGAPPGPPGSRPPAPQGADQAQNPPRGDAGRVISEDIFGFRKVSGIKRDPALKALPLDADSAKIIDQISRQFGISREKILETAARRRLSGASPAHVWYGVYDRLQALNRERFNHHDSKKYRGWSSFRQLANREYAPGWRGALSRALELHKHFLGLFVRLPYHLFDMFLFGYFRRNISFEFRHSTEDFLSLPVPARPGVPVEMTAVSMEKHLENAIFAQDIKGGGWLGPWRAKPWVRALERYFWRPAAAPLGTFLIRRVTLAVMSAVAMGLLGAFAPALPLSFALTSIPVLGPALVGLAHGLPMAIGLVPVIGDLLAPVVGKAMMALLEDMVLGPMLNTLVLSTLLTFPAAVRERIAILRWENPNGMMGPRDLFWAVAGAAVSWAFWSQNLKSFAGMATVGAEIEGIMQYAGGIDGIFNKAYEPLTGHKFELFHDIGAAVERPKGDSPIPFGGAITWGNVLLYKLQGLVGLNISDWVMHQTVALKGAAGETAYDPALLQLPAAAVIEAASHRDPASAGLKFDELLYSKDPAEVTARIKQLASMAGGLDAEIAAVKEHISKLKAELAGTEARIKELKGQSRPVTPEERAEYERLLEELKNRRLQGYVRSKLAEIHDLKTPPTPESLDRLRALADLQRYYDAILLPPAKNPGLLDDLGVKEASAKALLERLTAELEGRAEKRAEENAPLSDPKKLERISALLDEIEALRAEARGELATRDAARQLLLAANRTRNAALRDRRDGKEMLDFHQNVSKLATVMDLAFALSQIESAQNAIRGMQDLLEKKKEKIEATRGRNQDGEAQAKEMQNRIEEWRKQAEADRQSDLDRRKDIANYEDQSRTAAERIAAFDAGLTALIAALDAEDGGTGGDAGAEYRRRIALLPQVVAWRTDGGNPNDPDAITLKKLQEYLDEMNKAIPQAEQGVRDLGEAPLEFAMVAILRVPGPEVEAGANPSRERILEILAERKIHWADRRAKIKNAYDGILRRMDPANTASLVDEFGEAAPESLPRRRAQEAQAVDRARARIDGFTAEMDSMAAVINSVTGTSLPPLSGLGREALQDAVKQYGDKLKAVSLPSGDAPEVHLAKMNLISLARLLPMTAKEVIRWAEADATVEAIDDAMANVLPQAKDKIGAAIKMMDDILADADLDVAYVSNGGHPQELISRKIVLLHDKVLPALRGAKTLLEDVLIPNQRSSIDSARPGGDKLFKLFDSQLTLYEEAVKLHGRTLPWSLASFGAREGDPVQGHANVKEWRDSLQRNLDGYDDEAGHHRGVREAAQDMRNRKDPNFQGTETMYGEVQPFSLPRKIAQYSAERAQRAAQFNQQAREINEILGKIEPLSQGRYNLAAFRLPTSVTADQAGKDVLQGVADRDDLTHLADKLEEIGDWASEQSAGGGIGLQTGGGSPGTGTQSPIKLTDLQQMSLLALDGVRRIVPTSVQKPEDAPASYAAARFLYSHGVMDSAQEALDERVPKAEKFLGLAETALSNAIKSTESDDAYVSSNGTTEAGKKVLERKIRTFRELNAFLLEGMAFFDLKDTWNLESFDTIKDIQRYYDSIYDINNGGVRATDKELEAVQKMKDALKKAFDDLETSRRKYAGWMAQLNNPNESALRRINMSISTLQEKTRSVLEANVQHHEFRRQLESSEEVLKAKVLEMNEKQEELKGLLGDSGELPKELVRRVEALRLHRGSWAMDLGADPSSAKSLVVKKANFESFLDAVLGVFKSADPSQNVALLKSDLMANPQSLTALLPDAGMLEIGDDADGFYIVYPNKFSLPNTLEVGTWVTLGNVAQVWGNNVSVTGYQFLSPPSETNAPYGDKGVEVQVESLQGDNWVNYLNVDFHRFAVDVPPDDTFKSSARQSRIMIFDDYAMMVFGDKLYVGMAGFADFAASGAGEKPVYYGGNLKTSVKLTEVMRLNYQQQEMFANDPRKFMQDVNLDFTGYDPDLNRTYTIEGTGAKKHFSRKELGPSFDIARMMDAQDAFTLDLFFADSGGTDDITQKSVGAAILKGFTLKSADGKPWMVITNKAGGEIGEKTNIFSDKLSVALPDYGIVVSGEGKLMGDAKTWHAEIAKKFGERSALTVGYGSKYIGMGNRLSVAMNTSFTLGELWGSVTESAGETLRGGRVLKPFNSELDDFFKAEPNDPRHAEAVAHLKRAFETDVARRLLTQDIGVLSRDIDQLRQAGAVWDNTRVRGMVGFVTKPISNDSVDRAAGGGFVTGTNTEMSISRSQKELLDAKIQSVYKEGLRLQGRLLELSKEWQGAVVEIAQAQWELKLARFMASQAPSVAARAEGQVKAAQAESRLHQATLKYNILSGRQPEDPPPFEGLNASDLEVLTREIRTLLAAPERLTRILHSLDPHELKEVVGPEPFNLVDALPWVDRLTLSIGVQFQDMMTSQIFGIGGSVRLPVYDPSSKHADKAYQLEAEAALSEMARAYSDHRLAAAKSAYEAEAWRRSGQALKEHAPRAAEDLADAIRAYRNGLIGPARLRQSFDSWHWLAAGSLEADARAALADSWAAAEGRFTRDLPRDPYKVRVTNLAEALELAKKRSPTLQELGLRELAAAEMAKANDSRIRKAFVDVYVGMNLTAAGAGMLPSLLVTGIPVMPVIGFELKPGELSDLEVAQATGQHEYYARLQKKIEAQLGLQLAQNIVAARTAERILDYQETVQLPALERAYQEADARRRAGGSETEAVAALTAWDAAKAKAGQARLASETARAAINVLLGRSAESPLELGLDADAAAAELSAVLAPMRPADTEHEILSARVKVARAVESMVDKDLKVEQLYLEPVSLTIRSLGRLLNTLASDGIGNPDLVAAARVQTLNEERARDSFGPERETRIARARGDLDLVGSRLQDLRGKDDPASVLERLTLEGRRAALRSELAGLGAAPTSDPDLRRSAVPVGFSELKNRLAEKTRALAARPAQTPVDLIPAETSAYQSRGFARYNWAARTLGGDKIGQGYAEGWIEVRLRSQDTPPEVLLALSKLRLEKEDRRHAASMSGAAAQAEVLAERFAADVRMLRWADARLASPGSARAGQGELTEFIRGQRAKLESQKDWMAALLNLDPATPLDRLMALVPEDESGAGGLRGQADRFIQEIEARQLGYIRDTLFDGALPPGFGREDGVMAQIKADTIAQRMTYKGFTPVLAYGMFRGRDISGVFMEAPDPRAIARTLENVLTDVMRKELEANGRLQELTLKLHGLMSKVEDGGRLLEAQWAAIGAAKDELRARASLSTGPGDPELKAAQDRLVAEWLEFARMMGETKGDFIALTAELEALGQGKTKPFAARAPPRGLSDWSGLRKDSRREALDYWAERLLDPSFESVQNELMADLGVPAELREKVAKRVVIYKQARFEAAGIRADDFSAAETLTLLTKADVEGRRLKLREELGKILDGAGRLPEGRKKVLEVLVKDLRTETESRKDNRTNNEKFGASLREAYWHASGVPPAPFAVEGAVFRNDGRSGLEARYRDLRQARQNLLDSYLFELPEDPTKFILKDRLLDAYLQAQQSFDADLIRLFESPEVKNDRGILRALDALYDIRGALARTQDLVRSGRGMAALDALIMLEEARLAAGTWSRLAPEELDRVAAALQNLRAVKARWSKGQTELVPLYAVTNLGEGGRRLWTVRDWLTSEQVAERIKSGSIVERGGKLYPSDLPNAEVVGGVDAMEEQRDGLGAAVRGNEADLELHRRLARNDFALAGRAPEEGPLKGREGLSFKEVFGPGGLHAQGRLLFFDAPAETDRPGMTHPARHPLTALKRNPGLNAVFVYTGDKEFSRDRFPTLESLAGSEDFKDFRRVEVGPAGIRETTARLMALRDASLRQGWVELKLASRGFALNEKGEVAELFVTDDDFSAVRKAFKNAEHDLREAELKLSVAVQAESAARAASVEAKKALDQESLPYQQARARVAERLKGSVESPEREVGESDQLYQARVKIEIDKALAKDPEFKQAQKKLDPFAKAFNQATEDLRRAEAAAFNAKRAVEGAVDSRGRRIKGAKDILADSKVWTLYETKDLELGLDASDAVVSASAKPVYRVGGVEGLNASLGAGPAFKVRSVTGELYAAELDKDGRLIRTFTDENAVEKAAASWSMKSFALSRPEGEDAARADGLEVRSNYRLSHYQDPATGLPVLLNRAYLQDRLKSAQSSESSAKHWGLMPWRWGSLILEIPRGIIGTPVELATGRDPRQSHYLGRVAMYKLEGGATQDHGFFRQALGLIDVLNFLPDPVERFYDPSQFPVLVQTDSRVLPGESLFDKDLKDAPNSRNIHLGAGSAARLARQSLEDVLDSRARTLGHFEGGAQSLFLESRRGRERLYGESTRTGEHGERAISDALEDPLVASDPRSLGWDGESVSVGAAPGNIAVDRVEKRVRILPGARGYEDQSKALDGRADELARQGSAARDLEPKLKGKHADAVKAALEYNKDRDGYDSETRELLRRVQEIEWRIGRQEALEREIARLEKVAADLRVRIAWWQDYLKRLVKERGPSDPTDPTDPTDPSDPTDPGRPTWPNWWAWAFLLWALAALIAAIIEWIRRPR